MPQDSLSPVFAYHERTKHQLNRYARSLGYMDWATQPDPFRRFDGAAEFKLDHPPVANQPTYDELFSALPTPSLPMSRKTISRLFYESLAISAWKQVLGNKPWSLRINPSSGCLHPTESYLIVGPIDGLTADPGIYHYAPYVHALERRLALTGDEWNELQAALPADGFLIALTSIYWRESWKYGERAFRYCHHDVGHAIGALTFAAATVGWQVRMVETVSDDDLAALLGLLTQEGIEAEHADCLLAVFPDGQPDQSGVADLAVHVARQRFQSAEFAGTPNRLSCDHHEWSIIHEVSSGTRFHASKARDRSLPQDVNAEPLEVLFMPDRGLSAGQIIRQRRSAVDMDGQTAIDRTTFYHMMARVLPNAAPTSIDRDRTGRQGRPPGWGFPFNVFPWRPRVSLAVFVHRVDGLPPGLYLLIRDSHHEASLRKQLSDEFAWRLPPQCPKSLSLWLLAEADCLQTAKTVSCHQDIAADGVFALGMLAEFDESLHTEGPWFYPRLYWETGLIGQVLYLEAEAAGIRSTGIGCFFDDAMHQVLGIRNLTWQSLYHFTVGGAVEDLRLKTLPPYTHLEAT